MHISFGILSHMYWQGGTSLGLVLSCISHAHISLHPLLYICSLCMACCRGDHRGHLYIGSFADNRCQFLENRICVLNITKILLIFVKDANFIYLSTPDLFWNLHVGSCITMIMMLGDNQTSLA